MSDTAAGKVGPAGTVLMGEDGRVLLHTPRFADLVGRSGDDLRGEALPTLLALLLDTPFELANPPAVLHGFGRGGRRITFVVERLPGGQFCVSAADVTGASAASDALRRARRAAESASSAKSRVLATISHELRTPLNAVIGFSDALAQAQPGGQPIPNERVREYAITIREAGLVLLRQINNILDVVRLESGGIELSGDVIEVPRLIEAALRQSEATARLARVTLAARPAPVTRWLRGDERRLRQVLGHLLANALKFTPYGGDIAVETGLADDGDLLLLVRDSGIGIPEADLGRVFDPFGEDEPMPARRAPGVGFGLYFCRAIVEAHGGNLALASRCGEGTTVTLRLPRSRLVQPSNAPAATTGLLQELK
jgi:signal transduction histidine kinase